MAKAPRLPAVVPTKRPRERSVWRSLQREARGECRWDGPADTTEDEKHALVAVASCFETRSEAEIEERPAAERGRWRALMRAWDALTEADTRLTEDLATVDLRTGERSWSRGWYYLRGRVDRSFERLLVLRAINRGHDAALAERMRRYQARGIAYREDLAQRLEQLNELGREWSRSPPRGSDGSLIDGGEMRRLAWLLRTVPTLAESLARLLCSAWPSRSPQEGCRNLAGPYVLIAQGETDEDADS